VSAAGAGATADGGQVGAAGACCATDGSRAGVGDESDGEASNIPSRRSSAIRGYLRNGSHNKHFSHGVPHGNDHGSEEVAIPVAEVVAGVACSSSLAATKRNDEKSIIECKEI
jgi:hypothetical protein